MKTYIATPEAIESTHQFHLIDAENVVLGRLATKAAQLLTGKHKPIYTPFLDTGDHVIIVNAEKVKMTGQKLDKKLYRKHTRYPGGLKTETYRKVQEKKPELIITEAIRLMLPKSRLGRQMLKKLRVYAGDQHNHVAQKPVELKIG